MRNDCKIVQDLLPNYLEKVTSKETNEYIEEHMKGCKECSKIFQEMGQELNITSLDTKREVDYMKKFKVKKKFNGEVKKLKLWKKILKIIVLILLIVIILLLIHTIRNYTIISDMQNKMANYSNSTNWYMKTISSKKDGEVYILENYKKNDNEAMFLERNVNGDIFKMAIYKNAEKQDRFMDNNGSKTAFLDEGEQYPIPTTNIYNFLETKNIKQKILESMFTNIKSTNCDGKKCYTIKGLLSSTGLVYKSQTESYADTNLYRDEGVEIYVEKDTGLCIKRINGNETIKNEYIFDKVDDEIFVEPDISQYTLKKTK